MKLIQTEIVDLYVVEFAVYRDNRGWFAETYSKDQFLKNGISIDFVQDNHSCSTQKGIIRGLHAQINPRAQAKLVRCTKGSILDVAVDLRKNSPTFKKWVALELNESNHLELLIPKGFAHGFLTLSDNVEVQYKVDQHYYPEYDRSIRYDDPDFGIQWGIDKPVLSEKDLKAPFFEKSDIHFSYV